MKIIGIGKNYVNETSEIDAIKTGNQLIFTKPDSSLVTGNKDVPYPKITNEIAYEVELVAKIGKTAKDIAVTDAPSYISEIAIGIDYTAKDVLAKSRENKGPWALAKGFDGASPISSFKPITAFSDLNDINFDLKINGEQKQKGHTALMIYSFAEIIAYVSTFMTLNEGDLIFTGTPASGTGLIYKGDHLQASIEGELLLDFKMI
ncbi:2-keto-4-pentenoate hydratase/2-oxohepta-3-ene-1,7-dioic acid hydratase in catechol pathway [Jejuia pallidilutea]|jgi:2-keto-4-pentenoate hydratase/2-oxohepta-3-ene-1,7-dioic acid hydratase in catechol pathway|uniref:2-keto-4-pentenoate hydratase/2-oxohepta-3-ene-1,7-dioic acid hydratase in catechol pathway n=1 Tax=Jejuia pallidilutea TaxID=504487 RepID=A0A362X877_9FLAO|nr:fumarylacetoacetate hydrolase family protein [Jejuia pallidilutea]PQV45473.1 2-keto-4-pentenoate hydratase/2-oxohepta-3-ene-1,7-dioic acid hydratase in catechol pathway [Jejuia pallidilutea]